MYNVCLLAKLNDKGRGQLEITEGFKNKGDY